MKTFKNVHEYSQYLENDYDFGLGIFELRDFENFVKNREYEIFSVIVECDVEDDVIKIDDKFYWMVCRYDGMRFVEVDHEDLEYMELI